MAIWNGEDNVGSWAKKHLQEALSPQREKAVDVH